MSSLPKLDSYKLFYEQIPAIKNVGNSRPRSAKKARSRQIVRNILENVTPIRR